MTSWIKVSPSKQLQPKTLLFETTDGGFCSNFNQFLYAYAYSLAEGKPLQVYDLANCVAITYPLLKNTFVDTNGVSYTDGMTLGMSSTRRSIARVMMNAQTMPVANLRTYAQQIFQWNPNFIPTLQGILSSAELPAAFDIGVHIRVGDRITTRDRRTVPVDDYVRAAKKIQADLKKDDLDVFVMSDSLTAISEFKKRVPTSWRIYSLPVTLPNPEGHVQSEFNRAPSRARMTAYHAFMAELLVMQSIPRIICTMSSNVGRFLYYTVEHPENMVSVDERFAVK
jgi:hypothetical protein